MNKLHNTYRFCLGLFTGLFLITCLFSYTDVYSKTRKTTPISRKKVVYQKNKVTPVDIKKNNKKIFKNNVSQFQGCTFNNPACSLDERCVSNVCKKEWQVNLYSSISNTQQWQDDQGNLVMQKDNYRVIVPDTNATDYATFRLNNIRVCGQKIENKIGASLYVGSMLVDETRISSESGGSCCDGTSNFPIINNVTQSQFNTNAYSTDVYWKRTDVNYSSCLGGHEEVHRFLYNTAIPTWANEGLATYLEQLFRDEPGTPAARTLYSCNDTTFSAPNVDTGDQENIPYRNVVTNFSTNPRMYSYYTGACFWQYIVDHYGEDAMQEIIDNLYSESRGQSFGFSASEQYRRNILFIERAVLPVTGNSIWTFLNKIGIYPRVL